MSDGILVGVACVVAALALFFLALSPGDGGERCTFARDACITVTPNPIKGDGP